MTSGDFPDGSWEKPAIILDTDTDTDSDADEAPSSTLSGFELILLAAEEVENRQVLGFHNRDEGSHVPGENLGKRRRSDSLGGFVAEASNDWERRWAAEQAERHRKHTYETAKNYAFELHHDQIPKITQKQRKEEDEDVDGKGQFQKAKEAIEKRKKSNSISSITSSGIELNLTTERKAPTLVEMSARVLAENSEAIQSLKLVPDHLKKKISSYVSDLGKLNSQFMQLLVQDSPSEIFARNCVDLEEKDLINILCDCDRSNLLVLTLDLCGRSMTENAVIQFLKRSPNGFPSLTTLSLRGAFCLTDQALSLISRSAPLLQNINLSECSLLTDRAVKILADQFGSTLRGLNIGGCQGIKPSDVLESSLSKFKNLNYLSVAGLQSISDGVLIPFLISCGSNLTDLSLASCNEVTNKSIWAIGRNCPKLEALDISDLHNLTDTSLQHIADGCRSLNKVKLAKNDFSDEAVAAFLEVCGGSLDQLSINNVRDVGEHTAISLARVCKRLRYLDLSWCRKLTEEELRRILNCCTLLRSLKLFGWTQVKDEFLEELSRSQVRISGLKMTSVLAHLDDSYPSVDDDEWTSFGDV